MACSRWCATAPMPGDGLTKHRTRSSPVADQLYLASGRNECSCHYLACVRLSMRTPPDIYAVRQMSGGMDFNPVTSANRRVHLSLLAHGTAHQGSYPWPTQLMQVPSSWLSKTTPCCGCTP